MQRHFMKSRPLQMAAFYGCALMFALLTCALALTRIYSYKASLLDGGTFMQVLWNLVHIHTPLSTTNLPWNDQNWLGFHFSPVLFLLAPFYALWPSIALLQLIQSACFAVTGLVLFHALKAAGSRSWQALAGSLLFWCNPFVLSAAIWDFHEIAFATLFISVALWALLAQRFRAMLLALALLLLTKEHYGLTVAGFGLLWGLRYRQWQRACLVMALGVIAFVIILLFVMPALHGGTLEMLGQQGNFMARYGWLKAPPLELLQTSMRLLFSAHENIPGYMYVSLLLLSGLILPIAAPLYLLSGMSDLAANLLSDNIMPRHIATYHSAALIPVIIVAAWQGYQAVKRKSSLSEKHLNFCLIPLALLLPLSGVTYYSISYWELGTLKVAYDTIDIRPIRALVTDKPVSAQQNIGMFFANRERIYPFPAQIGECEAAIFQLSQPFKNLRRGHMGYLFGEPGADYIADIRTFMAVPGWHVAYWHAPWLVMMRGPPLMDERAVRADILRHIDAFAEAQ